MNRSSSTSKRDKRSDGDYQRAVGDFVNREVIYCVSNLVYEIGMKNIDEWHHLFIQQDWETPALEAIRGLPRENLLEQNDFCFDADATPETLASACLQHLEQ